jgi:hypothetical protein
MIEISKENKRLRVRLSAVPMGNDLSVSIYGGDRAHIGAVALGVPTPSHSTGGGMSASVSVLTLTGHKEDDLARKAAAALARQLERVVVVSCGIHLDAITQAEIDAVVEMVDALVQDLASQLVPKDPNNSLSG